MGLLGQISGRLIGRKQNKGIRAQPFNWLDSTCAGTFSAYSADLYGLQIIAQNGVPMTLTAQS